MDTTKVYMHGFTINIRTEISYQDVNVISECLGGDCYGFGALSKRITPEIVLDLGGHIGAFGMMAKKYWPDCRLIAVEPDKGSVELYRMNAEDNGFEAELYHAGISYNPDRTVLLNAPRTSGGHILVSTKEAMEYIGSGYRTYDGIRDGCVRAITIEDIVKESGLERIDFAKWDCEGGEILALQNLEDESAKIFKTMVGEYHLWGEGKKILQASPIDEEKFWFNVKRKFPHLYFNWTRKVSDSDKYGKFQAWPKSRS